MSKEPHHWLKLWISAATDPSLDGLDIADFGRWVKILLYVKQHGNMGTLDIPHPGRNICNQLHITKLSEIPKNLPNISIECNANTGVTRITVRKWYKYQVDNSEERVSKHRQSVTPPQPLQPTKKSVTPQDKKREDKNKIKENGIPYEEVIRYLNEKTKRAYSFKGKNREYIKSRWIEGYRLADFQRVIDVKVEEWGNNDYSKFLRPETLFGTKFDSYLNQKEIKKDLWDEEK